MPGRLCESYVCVSALDVDCDLLEATNDAVNVFLEAENITFDNLGDVVASAILDDAIFEQLRALMLTGYPLH
jgi:hypothetical protein